MKRSNDVSNEALTHDLEQVILRIALMWFRKSSTILYFQVILLYFLATSVTWTAPPPQWTQTNPYDIRTVNMSVLKGSQVALRWNYTLSPGSDLRFTSFVITSHDGSVDSVGNIFHLDGKITIYDRYDYQARFNISRTEVATLIINKVTEREETVYRCVLQTVTNTWRYRIRVIVTGENCNMQYQEKIVVLTSIFSWQY